MRKNFTVADTNYFTGIKNLPEGTIVIKSGGVNFTGRIYLCPCHGRRVVEVFIKQAAGSDIKSKQTWCYTHHSIPFENIDRITWKNQLRFIESLGKEKKDWRD